ncbi:hypothetical protein [Nostoc punctiforme]|nr:hypothetical protein [Nostoc punctiforme]
MPQIAPIKIQEASNQPQMLMKSLNRIRHPILTPDFLPQLLG